MTDVNSGAQDDLELLSVQREMISPQTAKFYLTQNNNFRKACVADVRKLTAEIRGGRWAVTGEPIIFDRSGALVDGQHRLLACVEAGVPIPTLVVRGVPVASDVMIDRGRSRRHADILAKRDIGEPVVVSGAANWLYKLYTGRYGGLPRPTDSILDHIVDRNPGLERSARFVASLKQERLVPRTVASCLHYLFDLTRDDDGADRFWTAVMLGSDEPTSAATQFHHRLISAMRMPITKKVSTAIFAWSKWEKNHHVRVLKSPSDLPVIRGIVMERLMPPSAIEFAKQTIGDSD